MRQLRQNNGSVRNNLKRLGSNQRYPRIIMVQTVHLQALHPRAIVILTEILVRLLLRLKLRSRFVCFLSQLFLLLRRLRNSNRAKSLWLLDASIGTG